MFEALMESYKNMNQTNKQKALIKELKKIIIMLQDLCKEKGIPFRQVVSDEILDANESMDNYLETMFVYIKYLEELLGSYIETTLE